MIKKFFLLCLTSVIALASYAQSAPGSWKVLPATGTNITEVIDTPGRVYFTMATPIPSYGTKTLFAYDKDANESQFISPGSTLSDVDINNIFYNPDGKYLMVTYQSGNIDLIYDSGKVVNLPEIKNSTITTSKNINTVKFDGENGRIYIGADFGMVVYDDRNHVVVESAIYNKPIKFLMPMGDKILIVHPDTGYLSWSPIANRHNNLDAFTPIQSVGLSDWMKIDDKNILVLLNGKSYNYGLMNDASGNVAVNIQSREAVPGAKLLVPTAQGWSSMGDGKLYFFDHNGALKSSLSLDGVFAGGNASAWNEAKSVWHANYDGLGNFDMSGSTATVLSDRFKPEGTIQRTVLHTSDDGNGRLYFHSETISEFISAINSVYDTPIMVEAYDWNTGEVIKCYPEVEPQDQLSKEGTNSAKAYGTKLLHSGASAVLADPVVDGLVYVITAWDGVLAIKDNKVVIHFNADNSPLETARWRIYGSCLFFDNEGNMWCGFRYHYKPDNHIPGAVPGPFKVLKKSALDRLRNNFNAPTSIDDWYGKTAMPEDYIGSLSISMDVHPSGKALYLAGAYAGPVIGYDTKNTTPTSDDVSTTYTGFIDQDGAVTFPTFKTALALDKNDWFWIGSSAGVYIVKDIDQLANGSSKNLNVIRPKVARNDGTNYADYLLSSETIYSIAVDANNNKWIATDGSGLYQVNADGTQMLKHFTKENSPLMSNTIYAVACNPNGNDVFIATPNGQYVYSSESAPVADDLSDVYAYPNPVRPDYDGWITITGLMDNTLVKITDAQGHTVFQGTSEGGMLVWDGCDASGDRVHSGVYLVFASTGSDQMSDKAVTKIVVIK